MPPFNREALLFSATLIASGLSQLTYSWVFSEPVWLAFGLVCVSLGIAVTALGLSQVFGPFERPLGITLLGVGYGAAGVIALFACALLFIPLLLLALVCFAISCGLIKGKARARRAALLISGLGFSASIVMSIIDTSLPLVGSVPLVPSVLGSVYLLWYLNRSHVTKFFDAGKATQNRFRYSARPNEVEKHPRGLIALTAGFLILALFLTYCYFNPLNDHVIYQDVTDARVQGAGELGSPASGSSIRFSAGRGDLLNYTFRVSSYASGPAHFWVAREVDETAQSTILEKIDFESSGSAYLPQTCKYALWVAVQNAPGQITARCDIFITSLSLRRPIMQSLLLSLFGAAASILLMLAPIKID